jgi:hypothetical protein
MPNKKTKKGGSNNSVSPLLPIPPFKYRQGMCFRVKYILIRWPGVFIQSEEVCVFDGFRKEVAVGFICHAMSMGGCGIAAEKGGKENKKIKLT